VGSNPTLTARIFSIAYSETPKSVGNLCRRHCRIDGKCAGGYAPGSRNYEPEGFVGVGESVCPIYADGSGAEPVEIAKLFSEDMSLK
jgi:hypothetical protein